MPLNLKGTCTTEDKVLVYLNANASEALTAKINAGVKTLAGALKYAQDEAQKIAKGDRCICVDDATVYGWIIHFFEEDSIEEPKKHVPRAQVPAGVKVTPPPPKKVDPQLSLFDNLTGATRAKTEATGTEPDPGVGQDEHELEPLEPEAGECDTDVSDPDPEQD
jgi:hypothetical protein